MKELIGAEKDLGRFRERMRFAVVPGQLHVFIIKFFLLPLREKARKCFCHTASADSLRTRSIHVCATRSIAVT